MMCLPTSFFLSGVLMCCFCGAISAGTQLGGALTDVAEQSEPTYRLELQPSEPAEDAPRGFLEQLEGALEDIAGPQPWAPSIRNSANKERLSQLLDHSDPDLLTRADLQSASEGSVQHLVAEYVGALDLLFSELKRISDSTGAIDAARRTALVKQRTLLARSEFLSEDLSDLHVLFGFPEFTATLQLPDVSIDAEPIEG